MSCLRLSDEVKNIEINQAVGVVSLKKICFSKFTGYIITLGNELLVHRWDLMKNILVGAASSSGSFGLKPLYQALDFDMLKSQIHKHILQSGE